MENRNPQTAAADLYHVLREQKNPDLQQAIDLALADNVFQKGLLDDLVSKNDTYRYNCFKVLLQISESQPQVLYPQWDYFVGLLRSQNSYHRSIALRMLANLTCIDQDNRFDSIFDQYFEMLDDEKIVTARYLAQNAWKIARSRPDLQGRIIQKLLSVEQTHFSQSQKDLLSADVIQSMNELYESSPEKQAILAFVEGRLNCSSPKTRQAAKAFLDRSTLP